MRPLPIADDRNRAAGTLSRSAILVVVSLLLAIARPPSAPAQQASPDFPVTNGAVVSSALLGNTLYIGGQFSWVGPYTGGFVAIDAATGLQQPGWPRVTGGVTTRVPDGTGGWYLGGGFTAINGVPRSNLAHLRADGTLDGWDPGANGQVQTMARSGSTLYIGGYFTFAGGQPRNYIAAIDIPSGAATSWDPNASWLVSALAVSGSSIFVGGNFMSIGGQSRNAVAELDLITGLASAWDPNATDAFAFPGQVNALVLSGGLVYAGGRFANIGGAWRNGVAALDASSGLATAWDPNAMGPFFGGTVNALALAGSDLYVGGQFISIGGQSRSNLAVVDVSSGLATPWNPAPDGDVYTLTVNGATVYTSGAFANVGGQPRTYLAAVDAGTGLATSWDPAPNGIASLIAVDGSTVFCGGFSGLGGKRRSMLAAIDVTTGAVTPWDPNLVGGSGNDLRLAASGSTVYVAGFFFTVGGQPRNGLAALDATTGIATSWDPAPDSYATSVTVSGSTVYVTGYFSNIGGQPRAGLAALDAGSGLATAWDPAPNGGVAALAVDGPTVYAGGYFTSIGGQPRNFLAALDAGTGLATAWDPAPDNAVSNLALSGPTVYVAGYFFNIGGQPRTLFAAVDVALGQATSWDPASNNVFNSIVVDGPTVYVGGSFTSIGGQPRTAAAALDGSTALASAWDPAIQDAYFASPGVGTLALGSGVLYAGGNFTSVCGLPHTNLAAIGTSGPTPMLTQQVSPNGGESLIIGVGQMLQWSASGGRGIASVDLYLSRSGPGGPWELLAAGVGNTGSYNWLVTGPAVAGSVYLRVDARDCSGAITSDVSDAGCSISDGATPTLVELFRAVETGAGVRLEWRLGDASRVAGVEPQRSTSHDGTWSRVEGAIEQREGVSAVTDAEIGAGSRWYRLAGILRDGGTFATDAITIEVTGPVSAFALSPLAPNPTRGACLLSFAVPVRSRVRFSLLDVQGREVAMLGDDVREAGRQSMLLQADDLGPGLYFLRMVAPGVDLKRRLVVVR